VVNRGRLQDYHLLWCGVPGRFSYQRRMLRTSPEVHLLSYNPTAATAGALARAWFRRGPGSFATTTGVVLSSSGY
jgi:hypothetical protein